ncbi:isoprenoid synthase domain-containing protein [Xylariomycetidae sp. FL2044]|nr:isoprenoid synthase domain-containing protein [Xylariomycetidae sp. FL2044]
MSGLSSISMFRSLRGLVHGGTQGDQPSAKPTQVSFSARIRSVCVPLDTAHVPAHFSRYPAAVNVRSTDVEDALRNIRVQATEQRTRERRRAEIRHSNPFGDPFAICHCSADPDRLVMLASIVEVMWIHDGELPFPYARLKLTVGTSLISQIDVTEELPHEQANAAHVVLAGALRLDIDPARYKAENIRQKALANLMRTAIDADPQQAELMVRTLRDYLATFNSRDDDFDTMKEYMPYRIANCGYWISSFFIRWGMGLSLSTADYESIREYDVAMGNVLGLTNDYFSWDVEKDQPTDRIRNGVHVLTKEHGVSAESAQRMLLGIIVEEEGRAARLKKQRLRTPVSPEITQYLEAIELYVGGSCYWHATVPRYQIFE